MVYEEPHKSHEKSEIVIKITPRNLERLIYIVIIIGLLTFSILVLRSKRCEEAEAAEETNSTENASEVAVAEVAEEEIVEEEVEEEEEAETTITLSGKIEFELISATACVINESMDQGRLKSVKVGIYNGLTGPVQVRVDLYVWNEDETLDILEDYVTSITNIYTIPSGITYTLPASIKRGIFKDIDEEKKVKAVIKYADDSEISSSRLKIIDDSLQNVKARDDC